MKNIDSTYVVIGALWLLIGLTLGILMGASHNFQFMPVHAHITLVGFACHAIFGMAYRQWPTHHGGCGSRLCAENSALECSCPGDDLVWCNQSALDIRPVIRHFLGSAQAHRYVNTERG